MALSENIRFRYFNYLYLRPLLYSFREAFGILKIYTYRSKCEETEETENECFFFVCFEQLY